MNALEQAVRLTTDELTDAELLSFHQSAEAGHKPYNRVLRHKTTALFDVRTGIMHQATLEIVKREVARRCSK